MTDDQSFWLVPIIIMEYREVGEHSDVRTHIAETAVSESKEFFNTSIPTTLYDSYSIIGSSK